MTPPTIPAESSIPRDTFSGGGELARTGSDLVDTLLPYGIGLLLAGACLVFVCWLVTYRRISRHPHTPLPHGIDHMEAWHDIADGCLRAGMAPHDAQRIATEELGWGPGDPL